MTLENILADFQLLDDWEDRYRYVIELGRALPPLPEAARTEANKVRGCASQVWLHDNEGPLWRVKRTRLLKTRIVSYVPLNRQAEAAKASKLS